MTEAIMVQETREIPQVIPRLLAENQALVRDIAKAIKSRPINMVVTIARGSSDHAALILKYAIELHLGLAVASFTPSVVSVYGHRLQLEHALVIGISQSGSSPDVVGSLRSAKASGAFTLAVTNHIDSPLAQAADVVLPLHVGEERAVAATKSFVASVVCVLQLIAELQPSPQLKEALHQLPEVQQQVLDLNADLASHALSYRYASSMMILARGLHFGVAQESALKLKETTAIHAEAYSTAEFSHGPTRIIEERFPVLLFQAYDETAPLSLNTATELQKRGADVLVIGAKTPLDVPQIHTLAAPHRTLDPLVSILPFYVFSAQVALARGMNPDHPPHLKKVTLTH